MKKRKNISRNRLLIYIVPLFFLSFIFLLTRNVGADGWNPSDLKGTGLTDRPIFSILMTVINWAITFIGILAVIIFIYGGFVYLTSQGESDKIEQGKKIILYAIVGIIVSVLGVVAVTTINSIITGGQGSSGSGSGTGLNTGGGGSGAPIQDPAGGMAAPAQDVSGSVDGGGSEPQQPYVRRPGGGGPLPVSPDMMQ